MGKAFYPWDALESRDPRVTTNKGSALVHSITGALLTQKPRQHKVLTRGQEALRARAKRDHLS